MDAGRLQLNFAPVNLSQLIEGELDDLSAQSDALDLTVEPDFPAALNVSGEKHFTTLIVRNLLENARKYNCPRGRIRVSAREHEDSAPHVLLVRGANRSQPRRAGYSR
jgi:signal transduction histidine kinase